MGVPKFIPTPSPEGAPYWAGLKEDEIRLPRCRNCAHTHHYPRAQCPKCWSTDLEWRTLPPRALLWSWTIVHNAFHEGWNEDTPYVVAIVELEPGLRIMSNLIDCPHDQIKVGLQLEAVFDHSSPKLTLLKFRSADAASGR